MRLSRYLFLGSMLSVLNGCSTTSADSASSSNAGSDVACVGAGCQFPSGSKSDYELEVDLGSGGTTAFATTASAPAKASVCGAISIGCNPDDGEAEKVCAHVVVNEGTGGTNSTLTSASGGVGGSTAGLNNPMGGTTASSSSVAGSSTGGAESSLAPSNTVDPSKRACRVVLVNNVAMTTCELAGPGLEEAACSSRSDCAAGYACVEESGGSHCRHYCCGGNDSCSTPGTFCEERELAGLENDALKARASVCMPATLCRLDEPYPCPSDERCSCPSGKACGVVRNDGTTSCVTPGAGQDGDSCPCAAGYVCSATLGQCLKVCSLSDVDSALFCDTGVCQPSPNLPVDFGICVNAESLL